jgi:predicted ATP-dependent endonuclease of OLD family
MIIRAFHIKNYRSIVDSGICHLSHDNITALIGQNESGKTSVLEALRSFYEDRITDDVLRSDQTFPEIVCIMELDEQPMNEFIDFAYVPAELHEVLKDRREIRLVRKWINGHKSTFEIAEPEILQFFETFRQKREKADRDIRETLPLLEKQLELLVGERDLNNKAMTVASNELNRQYSRIEELTRLLNKTKRPDIQIATQQELETCKQNYDEAKANLRNILSRGESHQMSISQVSGKLEQCRRYVLIASSVVKLEEEVKVKTGMIQEAEHLYELCSSEREARNILKRLEQLRADFNHLSNELKEQKDQLVHNSRITTGILGGQDAESALRQATAEMEQERNYYSPEDFGRQIYPHLPVFEFFEDFSSLLPNKIDLEDLLNENRQAEGYKAARNFLSVAGLNADFFREKNHRILKQKIENLNSEITIDFQDYWRQQVGKDDKIRLHFELEHYDYTVPEKSGKPYLEFWIKDRQERLYPKQRSRGVRWFLSFYLELKATAKVNHQNRVLLIDEPGLSLHARAQEDVLKVFEDLKGGLQIIYCTHSPHLIDLHKLYRIMAVQRARAEDETSETVVLDARSLNTASSDTLSPVYSLMGTRLNDKQFIYPRHNIIVSDTIEFYYLDTMARLFDSEGRAHFIPASGTDAIPVIANLLFGWKIDFGLLTFDNKSSKSVAEWVRKTIFAQRETAYMKKVCEYTGFPGIEDLFSTIDFKRYILKQRIGITERNTVFIGANNLSRIILASDFCSAVEQENLKKEDFDEETKENFSKLFNLIRDMVDS